MIKTFIKKSKQIARASAVCLLNKYRETRSYFSMKKSCRMKVIGEKIRVGFIVQMPEIWDKEEPIFELMQNDPQFDVKLVVVPPYDRINREVSTDYSDNFFIKKYKDKAIKGYNNGEWQSIKGKFDYVFFQRPYDQYLPRELRSNTVVRYAKCCYIPYGFSGSDVFDDGNTNKSFFKNIYFAFPESDHMTELLKAQFPRTKKLHNIENLGYPALEPYYNIKPSHKVDSILWTPRWSFDRRIGGSTFDENKDLLFELRDMQIAKELIFRPHPLLLDELIKTNRMTEKEVEDYLDEMKKNGIEYDEGKTILEAFQRADVLITDYSSVIIQYFLTEKPIIYCDGGIKLNKVFEQLSDGFYVAHNKTEVLQHLVNLANGYDYLEDRRKTIKEYYLSKHSQSSHLIVNRIICDAKVSE